MSFQLLHFYVSVITEKLYRLYDNILCTFLQIWKFEYRLFILLSKSFISYLHIWVMIYISLAKQRQLKLSAKIDYHLYFCPFSISSLKEQESELSLQTIIPVTAKAETIKVKTDKLCCIYIFKSFILKIS